MLKWLGIALFLCLLAAPASAALCNSVTVNPASTVIFPVPETALHYLFVQNVSEACIIFCALGSNNAAAYQHGTKLVPGSSWTPMPVTTGVIPSSADLACAGSNAGTGCTGQVYACEW